MKLKNQFGWILALLFITLTIDGSDDVEPPLGHVVLIGDSEVQLKPGEAKVLNGSFKNPTIQIIPDRFRVFTYAGLQFKYPHNFAFEADLTTPGVKLWTLDGSDVIIMVHQYESVELSARDMSSQLVEFYEQGGEATAEPVTRSFNGEVYRGYRVKVKLVGSSFFQDVLAIPTSSGSRLLILQDMPSSEKVSDTESEYMFSLMDATLVYE